MVGSSCLFSNRCSIAHILGSQINKYSIRSNSMRWQWEALTHEQTFNPRTVLILFSCDVCCPSLLSVWLPYLSYNATWDFEWHLKCRFYRCCFVGFIFHSLAVLFLILSLSLCVTIMKPNFFGIHNPAKCNQIDAKNLNSRTNGEKILMRTASNMANENVPYRSISYVDSCKFGSNFCLFLKYSSIG